MAEAGAFEILVNGKVLPISGTHSVADLLTWLGIPPQTALVEHNGSALARGAWPDVLLGPGDRVEILRVAAGG